MPGAICGTRAPTAKNFVATAIPIWPVRESRAMIDQVIFLPCSAARSVALHAARVGGGAAARSNFGGGGEAAFRPVGTDLDNMTATGQFVGRCLRHAAFDDKHAR